MHSFPIDSIKDQILNALDESDFLVIKSTPGSGKTTRVPLFLAEKYKKKIYVLEPRKLAAKLASEFVAKSFNESPGNRVGHIFKYENVTSDATQITFMTEGTFLRLIAKDPNLSDCDVVILDEFHERHYHTDVALSFLLKIKEKNKNLKVIIMSATINLDELEKLLGSRVKTLELNERKYQLTIKHLPNDTLVLKDSLEKKVYKAVLDTFSREGHILIFFSGLSEMRRAQEILERNFEAEIIILHGEVAGVKISEEFYDLSKKKIILSTNIAESSVTIPGVRTVIDSGTHKTSRLNPVTRLPLLELKKISQSSAIQRANRAAREADGLAIRLYAEFDYQSRDEFDTPEINRTDLSELLLNTAEIFDLKIEEFYFVTPLLPNEIKRSREYLEKIGWLVDGHISTNAKKMAKLPFHPRIIKILEVASEKSSESFNQIVNYLAELIEPKNQHRFKGIVKKYFNQHDMHGASFDLENAMLYGFIDQIAKIKGQNELVHMNGEVYEISPKIAQDLDTSHQLWIILEVDNRNHVTKLLSIEEEWLYDLPYFPIEETQNVDFDTESLKLTVERVNRVGAVVLSKDKIQNPSLNKEIIDAVYKKVLNLFKPNFETNNFKRLKVLEKYTSKKIVDYPMEEWLKEQLPFFLSDKSYTLEVILDALVKEVFSFLAELTEDEHFDLEADLPLFLSLHDKRKVELHYDATNGIHCESYIQDFFSLTKLPTILKGKEKIKIHLLGPHKRPLQVTDDLSGFWQRAYKELYGELKREYPRHHWPLNPESAKPILLLKNVK